MYIPRFSVEITEEQQRWIMKHLSQHGMKKALFNVIITDLMEAVNKNGVEVIGALMARHIKLGDITEEIGDG